MVLDLKFDGEFLGEDASACQESTRNFGAHFLETSLQFHAFFLGGGGNFVQRAMIRSTTTKTPHLRDSFLFVYAKLLPASL